MSHRAKWAVASIALLCFIWLSIEVSQGRTAAFDEAARDAVHSLASPTLTTIMRVATDLGEQEVVLGISAVLAAGLWFGRRRRDALLVAVTIFGAEVWMNMLKRLFHRVRPEPFFDVRTPRSYSFPSGHALLSLTLYGLLAALVSARLRGPWRWVVRIAAAALILAIGFSRVYLGVHYATDVIGGYLVAVVWLVLAEELLRR